MFTVSDRLLPFIALFLCGCSGSEDVPKVANCDGVYRHNMRDNVLAWRIETISADNRCVERHIMQCASIPSHSHRSCVIIYPCYSPL
jgi:hypothetical protein